MFTPWGNVAVIAVAAVLLAVTLHDVRRDRRLGREGWTSGVKLRIAALLLLAGSQVLTLT